MKRNKIIIWSIFSIVLTSCHSEYYRMITQVDRDGSCRREVHTTANSVPGNFPYDLSFGWKIWQADTVVDRQTSPEVEKVIKVSKKFNSVHELSADLRHDVIFPFPKESLQRRFRWFYTYYAFTAIFPEVTDKGRVSMDKYLNKAEQKMYLQEDMSAYYGMNGIELKEKLDDIESRFMKWYARSVYEECFDIILHYADSELHAQLFSVKDTVFSLNEGQIDEFSNTIFSFTIFDKFFATDHFSKLYAKNEQEIENMFEEKIETINELLKYEIQYELALPGKIMATNTDLQNDGVLIWKVNMYRFLADDYVLAAKSRVVNIWAFVVTLLVVVIFFFCHFCHRR